MQRLKVKEDLKPSASNGAFCILFVAVDKKYAVGGTVPTKEKHPSERKRKPAKRERIPTTSLRTGLGMTGLAYERIFSSPIKSTLPCTVSLRGNRRSAACGGYSEAVSRKCPGFHAVQAAGNRLTRRCVLLPTFPAGGKSGPLEARSLQKKSTRWSEKENLQGGNGFPRPACGLVSE